MTATLHIFVSWSDSKGRHHERTTEHWAPILAQRAWEAGKERVMIYRVLRMGGAA